MGKLAEDDELPTVAAADYGRRLNWIAASSDQTATHPVRVQRQNLIEVASACTK